MDRKQSNFIEEQSISDSDYLGFFGSSVNRKITWLKFKTLILDFLAINFLIGSPSTLASAQLMNLPVNASVKTKGCLVIGDGGSGDYLVSDTAPTAIDGYSVAEMANGRYLVLQPVNGAVNVLQFGVSGGLLSPAINRAIAFLSATGGIISIPAGDFNVNNESGSPASWDSRYAIYLNVDNIVIRGAGKGLTNISLNDDQDCHIFKVGTRTGGAVAVHNCYIGGVTIDGNRAGQTVPDDTDYHNGAIDVANDCTGIELENMHLHDIMYYGIGMQRQGFHNCHIRNILIEDTGGDGIDWKDDLQTNTGNTCENITVRRHGLIAGLSTPQAGVDLRGGVAAKNIQSTDYGAASGLVGIRTQQGTAGVGTPSAIPAQNTTIEGFVCKAATATGTSGLRSIIPYGKYSNGEASGCEYGIDLSYQDAVLANITSIANTNNYNHRVSSGVNPANHTMTNCTSRAATGSGVVVRNGAQNISYVNSTNRGSPTGYTIESGAQDCSIIGGNASNTTNVSDSGTNTFIKNVQGVRTASRAVSAGISIDSTGTKNFTIDHTLAFTPSLNDIALTLQRDTNVGDWTAGFLWVTAVSATQITGQLRVTAASATVGAVVRVAATTSVKG